jgi:DNA ligase 1
MLLTTFDERTFKTGSKKGWYMSKKYDGWRMIYQAGVFYTRAGNEIKLPARFYEAAAKFNTDVVLDGELWLGYGRVQDIGGVSEATTDDALCFMVFDMPSAPGGFHERLQVMKSVIVNDSTIQLVDHEFVKNDMYEHVTQTLDQVTAAGDEGLVLRPYDQLYQQGERPRDFLKLKKHSTEEAIVMEHHVTDAAKIREIDGYVSSIVCVLRDAAEGSPSFRLNWKGLRAPAIGETITIKFAAYTINGLPKFPTYVGIRDKRICPAHRRLCKHPRRSGICPQLR